MSEEEPKKALPRRSFLKRAGGLTALAAASSVVELPGKIHLAGTPAFADIGPLTPNRRQRKAYWTRVTAARNTLSPAFSNNIDNGDEALYPDKIGNYSKGLVHNAFGEVDLASYETLTNALSTGVPADFEAITMGAPPGPTRNKQTNPQSGLAFELEGHDAHQLSIPLAPAFASAEEAGEIVENYWMALLREVSFTDYGTDPLAAAACADLSSMSDFRGPKVAGQVTPDTLFRHDVPGALTGPWISQFFWKAVPFGANSIEQRIRTTIPGVDYMTNATDWLSVQNGVLPTIPEQFDSSLQYVRNGRNLGAWVHIDVLYQAYFHAFLIMTTPPDPGNPFTGGGIGCPPNPGNPYNSSATQAGFGTFGGPYFATVLAEVSTRALHAVWYQKWYVHRRLRPEAFAGAVHHKIVNSRPYNIHSDVLNSAGLAQVYSNTGSYFLPMAFPEGSPTHPAYGAGHATVAGACVTILKALFDESFVIPNPVVAAADGLSLQSYVGPALTVGGELNKIATNVAFGRNIAGVHWRSDGSESLLLGEEIAIGTLRDQRSCYNEAFAGYTFTKFDGTVITV